MLLPERCLEGCQHDSPPALPGPGVGSYVGTTVVRPQRPSSGQWVTNEPGVDEEAVTRQVWVLPCSDVSSGVVVQRSQQWSFRQTWARVPSLWYPATSLGGPVQRPAEGAMPPPLRRALFGDRLSVACRCLSGADSRTRRDSAGYRARESRRVGALASAVGRLASVVRCGVWSEARNVVRAWRGSHRVVRW